MESFKTAFAWLPRLFTVGAVYDRAGAIIGRPYREVIDTNEAEICSRFVGCDRGSGAYGRNGDFTIQPPFTYYVVKVIKP